LTTHHVFRLRYEPPGGRRRHFVSGRCHASTRRRTAPAAAVHHVVGGDPGWAVASDVLAWSAGRLFTVGDTLCKSIPHGIFQLNDNFACRSQGLRMRRRRSPARRSSSRARPATPSERTRTGSAGLG
uniref:Uncharacterized protein n=1 Tax=Aegilops tauschii subsp. strangulata TaxID=200361 RepID=A0A453PFC4_AEGTS